MINLVICKLLYKQYWQRYWYTRKLSIAEDGGSTGAGYPITMYGTTTYEYSSDTELNHSLNS